MKYYNYLKNKLKKLRKSIKLNNSTIGNNEDQKKIQIIILSFHFNYRTLLNFLHYTDYTVHFFSLTPKNVDNFFEYFWIRNRINYGLSLKSMKQGIITDSNLLYTFLKFFTNVKLHKLNYITKNNQFQLQVIPYFSHPKFPVISELYLSNLNEKFDLEFKKILEITNDNFIISCLGLFNEAYNNQFLENYFKIQNRINIGNYISSKGKLEGIFSFNSKKVYLYKLESVFILTNFPESKLDSEAYIYLLKNSAYFIQAPGVIMPLAHNLFEGISLGSIPIISHKSVLYGEVIQNKNILIYSTLNELEKILNSLQSFKNLDNLFEPWEKYYSKLNNFRFDDSVKNYYIMNESKYHLKKFAKSYFYPKSNLLNVN
jgi:hypothetical protein